MGQFIQFGQKVQKTGIDRFDCVEGVTVKGVLLNYAQPYVRNIAFDEARRRYVECVEDMAIKYKLDPTPRYYFVVASFATDVNGNIIGDKEQKVTFIQMKNKSYEEFVAQSNNLASWHGFVTLVKVNQGDYSYIKATPADDNANGFNISQALKTRIQSMSGNEEFIKRTTDLIDDATGMTKEQYEEFVANYDKRQNNDKKQKELSQGGNTMYVTKPQQAVQSQSQPQLKAVQQTNEVQTEIEDVPDSFGAPIDDDKDLPF